MKQLLRGRFAPVTHSWGFLQAPLEELIAAFRKWLTSLDASIVCERFESDLATSLPRLEPLNVSHCLLMATPTRWTAVFNESFSGPQSEVAHVSKTLPCRGILVTCVDNTYDLETNRGTWGAVQLCTFAPDASKLLNDERTIYAVNNCGQWEFHASGPAFQFEQPERYQARRIRDRFTAEMLEQYCLALGIRLFDETFYGPRCALFRTTQPMPPEFKPETYENMRDRLGLS